MCGAVRREATGAAVPFLPHMSHTGRLPFPSYLGTAQNIPCVLGIFRTEETRE